MEISKVCCVTLDNASSNNLFMHKRCSAHILNLIVSDGLKEIDLSIRKIRATLSVFIKVMLILDVPTRWNSTYLMLDVAKKYEHAFYHYEYVEDAYAFYDATLSFSGSLHITANTFFKKLVSIRKSLNKWRHSDNLVIQRMTRNMQLNISFLILVAIQPILDDEFRMKIKKKQGVVQKNELDRYLEDDVEDDHAEFDILNCSLSSTTIKALICAQNWLRSTKQNVNDLQVEINEAEKIESGL
ncbi:hypothetical protein GYH30_039700 [Glycine max]|nr:hypothetical protein GYH30_039700 [Glycine max]